MSERESRSTGMDQAAEALLAQLPEGPMKAALRAQPADFAEEMLLAYFAADPAGQADIEAFFTSDGERVARETVLDVEEGVPTSDDLAEWATPAAPEGTAGA